LAERGARIFLAGGELPGTVSLPIIPSTPLLEPILQIQSFYRAANALALARDLDPDAPPHLQKVTETL
jgi:glucosamine--fructose-6-phosphate aminotransferase (isomerizing)